MGHFSSLAFIREDGTIELTEKGREFMANEYAGVEEEYVIDYQF